MHVFSVCKSVAHLVTCDSEKARNFSPASLASSELLVKILGYHAPKKKESSTTYGLDECFQNWLRVEVEWRMDDHAEGPSTLPHGRKRPANDHLESDQRLAKRFNLLSLSKEISPLSYEPSTY